MTTRERWIVYPLLALALGSSIKSRLVHRFECHTLVVRQIEIVDRRSRPQAILTSTPDGAELSFNIEIDGKSFPQAVLRSTRDGGELSLLSLKTPARTTISPMSILTSNVMTTHLNGRPQLRKPRVPADARVPHIKIESKQPAKEKPEPKE